MSMNDTRRIDSAGRDLWRRATSAPATKTRETIEAGETIEDWEADLLAAALDHGAGAEEREALEARLADSPALFEAWVAARDMSAADEVTPPAALRRAIKGLPDRPRATGIARQFAWPRRSLEWAVVAVALLVVSWVGFDLGRSASLETVAARDDNGPIVVVGDFDGPIDPFAETINRDILSNGDTPNGDKP